MGDHQYLHNLTLSVMGQCHITVEDLAPPEGLSEDSFGLDRQGLYQRRSEEIKALLRRMRPETLGRIAVCGKSYRDSGRCTSLYEVHCATYLSKYADGKELLCEIACTAIVAKMADILRLRKDYAAAHRV